MSRGGRGAVLLAALAVGAAAVLAYLPSLSHELVWDDALLADYLHREMADRGPTGILELRFAANPGGQLTSPYYRPIPSLAIALCSFVAPAFPGVYHALNLALFAACSLLVLWFLLLVLPLFPGPSPSLAGGSPLLPAAAGALLFALSPLHVESVTPASGSTDLWMTLFVLLSTLAWIRARWGGAPRPRLEEGAAAFFLFLGCLSKEPAILLPLVLLAASALLKGPEGWGEWWARERRPAAALLLELAAYGALRAGVFLSPPTLPSGTEVIPPEPLVPEAPFLPLLFSYLGLLGLPWPLHLFWTPELLAPNGWTAAGILLLAGLAGAAFAPRRLGLGGVALVWAALFLLPALLPGVRSGASGAERFLFLPSVAVSLAAAATVENALGAGRGVAALALLSAVAVAGAGWAGIRSQVPLWRDSVTLSSALTRESPELALGWGLLGDALSARGRHREAAEALREAVRLHPDDLRNRYNLGGELLSAGLPREAADSLARAVSLAPRFAPAWVNLGAALRASGKREEAIAAFRHAEKIDPGVLQGRISLLLLLLEEGRIEEARREAEALRIQVPELAGDLDRLLGRESGP